MLLITSLVGLAPPLAAVWIYGVVSHSVAQGGKRHPPALGANPAAVVALIVRSGMALAALGV